MKARAIVPLNHNDRTIEIGEEIELEDEVAAKTLIACEAVEEVKETVAPVVAATKVLIENKIGETKW